MDNLYKTSLKAAAFLMLAVFFMLPGKHSASAQEVTGLSDWNVFIDPGHSQTENMGLFGYSEAEKVLRVAWALRDMFQDQTDIDTVYMARLTDQDVISLEARVALANTLGADFYYSIHSDAGPSHVNRTLMLYGGWKSNGEVMEKTPEGGADYGAILDWDLTGAMRIDRSGNYADRVFYQGDVHHHANQFPFLYVNRVSTMASLLSEAGFHTNPGQQMLNLNHEWKTLEALSAFRSFLEWHDIDRPAIGVATGVIKDVETGLAINGATVTIGDQTYTTDSYESLFHNYSNNPEQLRNGFYFIQGLEPLDTVEVTFAKEGYQTLVTDLPIVSDPNGLTEENLSFLDPLMTSSVPPVVVEVLPADDLDELIPGTPLLIKFSRKMNKASVEEAFSMDPEAPVTFTWNNDFILNVNTSEFEYLQDYTITIDGSIARNELTDQYLDGNADGEEGGNYVFSITMSDEDTDPPMLLHFTPREDTPERVLRPIIQLVYDEVIIEESIGDEAIILTAGTPEEAVAGVLQHTILNEQSILHFFPTEDLVPGNIYTVYVAEGLSDMFFNETEAFSYQFLLLDQPVTQTTVIDNFNAGIVNWWHPDQAGQTLGIIPELTYRVNNTTYVNHSVASTQSMELGYGWDMAFSGTPYIRLYLPPTASQNQNRFNIDDILQVYVYGDGSHNDMRLVIRDGLNQLEAQQWITIDWMGWKLVSWDLANDPVFGWVNGNGELNGANFYMDGFHMRYADGGAESGIIHFDHLHFVKREEVQYPTTLFENWQGYDDFTTDLFPWITVDVEGDVTWNPQGFTFPGSGEPYAFKVMNPEETTPPIDGNHPAVDGDKYLIAMMSQETDENKWLISPQLKATEITQLSFYAKSIETDPFGPERIRVLISLDDGETFQFDPENFTVISEGEYIEVPDQWTQYNYFLGDHAGEVYRFAIQYVSHDDYMLMLDKFEVGAATTYTLTLDATPEDGGQVTGAGEYAAGQEVTVTAIPATGFAFDNWADADGNQVSTSATYIFNMPGNNLSLTAHFVPATYNLVLKVSPEDAGTTQGEGSYFHNEVVTVSTTANEGFEFLHWRNRDGDIMSEEQEYTFPMPAINNYELTAVYEEIPQFYAVTLTAQPEEGGAVYGEGTYEAGETIYATAAPADNYIFLRWTNEEDEEVSTSTMYSFLMPAEDIALIAHFKLGTGIANLAEYGTRVFPNPARSQINIESDYLIDYIAVTDITGRNVATVRVDDYLHTFETGNYPRGLYLLRIQTENGILHKKIQIIE